MSGKWTTENYAVIDVETDGLDARECHLLEIAVAIVDPVTLEVRAEFYGLVDYSWHQIDKMKAAASEHVQKMHTDNGLWERLEHSDITMELRQLDEELREFLSAWGAQRQMPVMGNSVRLDMNFMDEHLPSSAEYLDYHMRDVSTIAGLANDWYGVPAFEKKMTHIAANDVHECIAELKYYRDAIFKAADVSETAIAERAAGWTPLSSFAEEVADLTEREGVAFREALAAALHEAMCTGDHDEDKYTPTVGGRNRYQRHADALIEVAKAESRESVALSMLDQVRTLFVDADSDWPKVANDEQYIALGSFLSDLDAILNPKTEVTK